MHITGDSLQELKQQLAAIPTKQDMEGYISRLESAYKAEIQALTTNIFQFTGGLRVSLPMYRIIKQCKTTLSNNILSRSTCLISLKIMKIATDAITCEFEVYQKPSLLTVFINLLGVEEDAALEIDRASPHLRP